MEHWASWTLALVLGGLFLWSGAEKLKSPLRFMTIVGSYGGLIYRYRRSVAVVLPGVEMALGMGIILPVARLWFAVCMIGFQFVFLGIQVPRWDAELPYGCGCFWGQTPARINAQALEKNVLILLGAIGLVLLSSRYEAYHTLIIWGQALFRTRALAGVFLIAVLITWQMLGPRVIRRYVNAGIMYGSALSVLLVGAFLMQVVLRFPTPSVLAMLGVWTVVSGGLVCVFVVIRIYLRSASVDRRGWRQWIRVSMSRCTALVLKMASVATVEEMVIWGALYPVVSFFVPGPWSVFLCSEVFLAAHRWVWRRPGQSTGLLLLVSFTMLQAFTFLAFRNVIFNIVVHICWNLLRSPDADFTVLPSSEEVSGLPTPRKRIVDYMSLSWLGAVGLTLIGLVK